MHGQEVLRDIQTLEKYQGSDITVHVLFVPGIVTNFNPDYRVQNDRRKTKRQESYLKRRNFSDMSQIPTYKIPRHAVKW